MCTCKQCICRSGTPHIWHHLGRKSIGNLVICISWSMKKAVRLVTWWWTNKAHIMQILGLSTWCDIWHLKPQLLRAAVERWQARSLPYIIRMIWLNGQLQTVHYSFIGGCLKSFIVIIVFNNTTINCKQNLLCLAGVPVEAVRRCHLGKPVIVALPSENALSADRNEKRRAAEQLACLCSIYAGLIPVFYAAGQDNQGDNQDSFIL